MLAATASKTERTALHGHEAARSPRIEATQRPLVIAVPGNPSAGTSHRPRAGERDDDGRWIGQPRNCPHKGRPVDCRQLDLAAESNLSRAMRRFMPGISVVALKRVASQSLRPYVGRWDVLRPGPARWPSPIFSRQQSKSARSAMDVVPTALALARSRRQCTADTRRKRHQAARKSTSVKSNIVLDRPGLDVEQVGQQRNTYKVVFKDHEAPKQFALLLCIYWFESYCWGVHRRQAGHQ